MEREKALAQAGGASVRTPDPLLGKYLVLSVVAPQLRPWAKRSVCCGAGYRAGPRTTTGICRSVLAWYSSYAGHASTASVHQRAFSSPCTSRATIS